MPAEVYARRAPDARQAGHWGGDVPAVNSRADGRSGQNLSALVDIQGCGAWSVIPGSSRVCWWNRIKSPGAVEKEGVMRGKGPTVTLNATHDLAVVVQSIDEEVGRGHRRRVERLDGAAAIARSLVGCLVCCLCGHHSPRPGHGC